MAMFDCLRENKNLYANCMKQKNKREQQFLVTLSASLWSHLGLNQGPPDYESDALTN